MEKYALKNNGSKRTSLWFWVSLFLLLVIIALVAFWRPWENKFGEGTRTVDAVGETTVTAVPDEFVFYPNYQFSNVNKEAGLAEAGKKSDEIVKKLKELGVADKDIKTNASGYQDGDMISPTMPNDNGSFQYTLTLTVKTTNKNLAQSVQDYLATTGPVGQVTPQANFSDTKRREIESDARNKAAKDARSKADQLAKNLGFEVDAVKSVDDSGGFDQYFPMFGTQDKAAAGESASSSFTIQPGENELKYRVRVVYFIK